MLADWEHVVEVEAVICGVLDCVVVDGHSAEPADRMPCFALREECGLVFFELACGLADSWHVVTALWCFVPESDRREVECVVVIMVVCAVWRHGWLGSDRWYFVLFRLLCR